MAAGRPVRVGVHDFPDPAVGKAIPYGIYDIGRNTGWVTVGSDHDTVSFAVEALRRWWRAVGEGAYPTARRLLLCADAGGSNGYRVRLWKLELARLARETGLAITYCHFPPGTSKWTKIEHRLFAQSSMHWRGRPLTSHEVVVELIGATTTRAGLTVQAHHDPGTYPRGVKVWDAELASVPLTPHDFHGECNYRSGQTPALPSSSPTLFRYGHLRQILGFAAPPRDGCALSGHIQCDVAILWAAYHRLQLDTSACGGRFDGPR